ncbi:hypothetical protein M0R04_14560 [Candidatus Dojkabacteria bacterium]|jgi:hypothetical protein|nr:hypothetical protein [Candidatus Dojkabacteria bacterium]
MFEQIWGDMFILGVVAVAYFIAKSDSRPRVLFYALPIAIVSSFFVPIFIVLSCAGFIMLFYDFNHSPSFSYALGIMLWLVGVFVASKIERLNMLAAPFMAITCAYFVIEELELLVNEYKDNTTTALNRF